MHEDDLNKFLELQRSFLDGTYYTMNEISDHEKQTEAKKQDEPSNFTKLLKYSYVGLIRNHKWEEKQ